MNQQLEEILQNMGNKHKYNNEQVRYMLQRAYNLGKHMNNEYIKTLEKITCEQNEMLEEYEIYDEVISNVSYVKSQEDWD